MNLVSSAGGAGDYGNRVRADRGLGIARLSHIDRRQSYNPP